MKHINHIAFAVLLVIFTLFNASVAQAQSKPTVQRLADNDLVTIRAKVRYTTLVKLPEGEELKQVTCGDSEWWVIEGDGSNVYVKPSKEGAQTNLNIITKTGNVYSFLLREITKAGVATKEKPDLVIILSGDDVAKLRKVNEDLEELLVQQDQKIAKLTEEKQQRQDLFSSKVPEANPQAETKIPIVPVMVEEKPSNVAIETAPVSLSSEIPTITIHKVEKQESGLPVVSRFLRRVGKMLGLL